MAASAGADHEWDNDGQLILTGSANAYVATTARRIKGYYQGLRLCGRANFTNTGAATITVDEAGPVAICKAGNVALAGGEIINGDYYDFIYDAANNVMQAGGAATAVTAGQGKQTIWVPAGAMEPNPGAAGPSRSSVLTAGQAVLRASLDFDPSTTERAQFTIAMPKSWDEGPITFQYVWSHPATATNFGVAFKIDSLALGDGDPIDTGFPSPAFTLDTGGTTDVLYISPESGDLTPSNTPIEGDVLFCRLSRIPADAGDTLAVDARIHGVKIFYTTNAPNDA